MRLQRCPVLVCQGGYDRTCGGSVTTAPIGTAPTMFLQPCKRSNSLSGPPRKLRAKRQRERVLSVHSPRRVGVERREHRKECSPGHDRIRAVKRIGDQLGLITTPPISVDRMKLPQHALVPRIAFAQRLLHRPTIVSTELINALATRSECLSSALLQRYKLRIFSLTGHLLQSRILIRFRLRRLGEQLGARRQERTSPSPGVAMQSSPEQVPPPMMPPPPLLPLPPLLPPPPPEYVLEQRSQPPSY